MNDLIDKYHHNAEFCSLVRTIEGFMIQNKMTPQDVRDAAFVAGILIAERLNNPINPILKREPFNAPAA